MGCFSSEVFSGAAYFFAVFFAGLDLFAATIAQTLVAGLAARTHSLRVAETLRRDRALDLERVKAQAQAAVLHAVRRLGVARRLLRLQLLRRQRAAHLVGAHDAGHVRVRQLQGRQHEALLHRGLLSEGAEDLVQLRERTLGPDHEAAEVTTGGQRQQVQRVHVADVKAEDVAEGAHTLVVGQHQQGATALHEAAVAGLAAASAQRLRVVHAVHVVVGADRLQERNGVLSLLVRLDRVLNNERHLSDVLDLVATGQQQRRHGSRGERGRHGVALLVQVDAAVPAAVRLGRGEHATVAALVAERTSSRGVRAATLHTRDTRHSAAGTPRLRGVLHAGQTVHTVRLAAVLRHLLVHELHNVAANRRREDRGEGAGAHNLILAAGVHRDGGAGGHVCSETIKYRN